MRSAVIVAALAAGACAKVVTKDVFVTDWTVVTVTETVTQWPTGTVSTTLSAIQDHTKAAVAPLPTTDAPKNDPATEVETVAPSSTTTSSLTTSSTTSSTTQAEVKPTTTAVTTSAATTSASTTTAAATTTAAPAPGAGSSYQESILRYHNIHRSDHSAPALTWSTDLEQAANTLASRCEYGHDTSIVSASGAYGQNIAYGYDKALVGEKIISEMMYTNEAPSFAGLYGQASPDMTNFSAWGHFTQIVWKDTTQVGCATVSCSDLKNVGGAAPYTVCNYGTPGNYAGAYAENVLKPKSA